MTHPRIFNEPTPLDVALEFLAALRSSPAVVPVVPGERHREIFVPITG